MYYLLGDKKMRKVFWFEHCEFCPGTLNKFIFTMETSDTF